MIIEAKPTTIKSSDIKMMGNYVLIKMDADNSTYQMKGRETGIIQSSITYDEKGNVVKTPERMVSQFGTVIKAPSYLNFNRDEMKKLHDLEPIRFTGRRNADGERERIVVHPDVLRRIGELKKSSVDYGTTVEVKEGDRVQVSYVHFLQAEKQGLFIYNTDIGDLVMIKYDQLRMVVDENNQPKKMLNGLILIKPKKYEVYIKEDDGVVFTETESGIALLNPKETKRTRKQQIGTVLLCGTRLTGYLNDYNLSDEETMYNSGEQVLYDPRLAIKLENDLHQIISEEDLYLIRREAILLDEKTFPNFDKIELK